MASLDFPMSRAVKGTTMSINVTGLRVWKWRMACGLWLIRLACYVIGCGLKVDR